MYLFVFIFVKNNYFLSFRSCLIWEPIDISFKLTSVSLEKATGNRVESYITSCWVILLLNIHYYSIIFQRSELCYPPQQYMTKMFSITRTFVLGIEFKVDFQYFYYLGCFERTLRDRAIPERLQVVENITSYY